jgi:hypothetical protein
MSDSQVKRERNEDIEKSQAARPTILAGLRAGEELLSIAKRVSEDHDVEEKKAYKWVTITDEEFTRRKKLVSTLGLLVLWLGALTVVSGLVMLVIGFEAPGLFGLSLLLTLVIAGAVVMVPGVVLSLLAAKLVFRLRK